jgi:thymidylate synthase (FAD)
MLVEINTLKPEIVTVLDGQGSVELVEHMGSDETITRFASICVGKEEAKNHKSLLKRLLLAEPVQHMTPFEHVCFAFRVKCPLFVRSQWVRHRSWCFLELSRRMTHVTEKDVYFSAKLPKRAHDKWKRDFEFYESLLAEGVKGEDARQVLTQNQMTEFYGTVKLRHLLDFFKQRDDEHAQSEIQEYAQAMKQLIRPYVPLTLKIFEAIKHEYKLCKEIE